MTLSKKLLTAIILTVAGLGIVLFAAWSAIQLRSYAQLEEQDTLQNVGRAVSALDADVAYLDNKVTDWANWNDTIKFIETGNRDFLENNVNGTAMAGLAIDVMLFADSTGRIVHGQGYDFHAGRDAPISVAWPALLASNRRLREFPDLSQGRTGIVMLPEGPMIVAARPVLDSQGNGPSHGTILMGRYLDGSEAQELAATAHLSLSAYLLDDPQLPGDLRAVRPALSAAAPFAVRPLDNTTVAGYALLSDIDGQPVLILRLDQPRTIYQQGESSLLAFLFTLLCIGLVLGSIILAIVRKLVLQPIAQLQSGVEQVAQGDLSYRLALRQRDEIGQLARSFSDMASSLAEREAQVAAITFELRRLNRELAAEISERMRAQEATQAYASKLERSNRELQDFAYMSSHDLQEPLRKVQAFAGLLREDYGPALDDTARDYMTRMQNAAARMQSLIEGLLCYSRVTTQARPFARVDLSQIAKEVVVDLETHIADVNGTVEVQVLPAIDAEPLQMRQLLQNLIGNALKFHREGVAPVVTVRGRLLNGHGPNGNGTGAAEGQICEISVEDNGIGFDEKYADRVFQIFQRLHGRGTYEGAGIGLSVCRKITERHGGSIAVRSVPGRGSNFTVTLPVCQTEEA